MVILCYMSKQYTVTGGASCSTDLYNFYHDPVSGQRRFGSDLPHFLKQTEGNHDE